ncbi:hypothetical protein Tco_0055714 [Tanacetum coccineum]
MKPLHLRGQTLTAEEYSRPQMRLHVDLFPTRDPLWPLTVASKILGNPNYLFITEKKSTGAQESAYSESRTISPRRQRRSRSPRHNPSVFTRLRRERSRSPRHEYKSKARRESTMFKRLRSKGRSTSVHFDSRQESSRYTKNHSESEDSEGGH